MAHKRFAAYLRKLQESHTGTGAGSIREFADLLHVAPSHLSRAMGTTRNSRPFDLDGLFDLAEATGENIDTVLRAAGRDAFADRLQRHYGPPRPPVKQSARAIEILKLVEEIEASNLDPDGLAVAMWVLDRSVHAVRQRRAIPKVRPHRRRRAV